jgi:hypothetical protein
MKTLVKTFAIAALTALNFIANANYNESIPTKSQTFAVGMYNTVNTLSMNVMIEKTIDATLTVVLKNHEGEILYKGKVDKDTKVYHGKYDMQGLADGKYTFEFTKGNEIVKKEVNLITDEPTDTSRLETVE